MSQLQLLNAATSPFGRCNRAGLFAVTCTLLGIELVFALSIWLAGFHFTGPLALVLKLTFFWLGFCAVAKRLHDVGRSAWWIPGMLLLMIVWSFVQTLLMLVMFGAQILNPTGPVFWLSVAGTLTPALATTIWLHFAQGEPNLNRYGPPPGPNGFSSARFISEKCDAQTAAHSA